MAAKKTCPSCKEEIDERATKCPKCQKELEILYWEIESESGDKVLYSGEGAETSVREHLVFGKLKLSDRCRQYSKVLEQVEAGTDHYGLKEEMEWKTLREYADNVFSLQVLYNPVKAYGKRVAQITWVIVGIITALAWIATPLLTAGTNPIIAIVLSIVLLLLEPTVVGLVIASAVVGLIYDLPYVAMGLRTLYASVIGALVGGAIGLTFGYLTGVLIGLTRRKVVEG